MKIIGPDGPGKIGVPPKQKNDGVKSGNDFSKVLAEENAKIKGGQKTGQAKQASAPQFPSHMSITSVEGAKGEKSINLNNVIAMTEQLLTRIDFFKAALENPKVDITKFSPLVESLKSGGENLGEISSKLSLGSQLKSVVDETSILATTEAMKFNRGDYG